MGDKKIVLYHLLDKTGKYRKCQKCGNTIFICTWQFGMRADFKCSVCPKAPPLMLKDGGTSARPI